MPSNLSYSHSVMMTAVNHQWKTAELIGRSNTSMKLGEEVVKHRFEEALLKHPSPLEYEPVTTQKTTSDIYCCMFKYETL